MRKNYEGREEELGLTLKKRLSRGYSAEIVTDLDFADLICEEINQAQSTIERLENEAAKVGLICNAKKTDMQIFNHEEPVTVKVKAVL